MTSRTHNRQETPLLARAAARMLTLAAALTMAVLMAVGLGVSQANAAPAPAVQSAATEHDLAARPGLSVPSGALTLATAPHAVGVKLPSNRMAAASPWSKTWAFTQCIFGAGVPLGVALGIATTPALVAWFAGRATSPPLTYGWAASYWSWLKNRCAYALF